jgi:hypothetical protein
MPEVEPSPEMPWDDAASEADALEPSEPIAAALVDPVESGSALETRLDPAEAADLIIDRRPQRFSGQARPATSPRGNYGVPLIHLD